MGWFSRKNRGSVPRKETGATAPGRATYQMPSDDELSQRLRDIEEINARLAGPIQQVMREMHGQEPADTPGSRMETARENVKTGGLSYIASPPADFPAVAPEAHKLWLGDALLASMMGDDLRCLSAFEQCLEITRRIGHKTGEVRLLYNIGVAHYKLGSLKEAIDVLLEGKSMTEGLASELGREARKARRFEEERKTDSPTLDVFGTPHMEQQLLEMYLEALATVYDADSQAGKAAGCRNEIKRLQLQGV